MSAPAASPPDGTDDDASEADVDPGELLRLDRQLCFALAATTRSVIALYRPVLEPMGLTHPQYLVMLALWEKSPRRLGEIGDALHLDPATLSPLVKRLESAGYVVRDRDKGDARSLAIGLTPVGDRLRRRAVAIPRSIVARLGMPLEELERTRDALTTLLDAARTSAIAG